MDITTFREQLFAAGEQEGFTDMEIYYEKSDRLRFEVFEGEVDGYESATVNGVSFRGIYNGNTGYAYTEKIEEDSISYLLKNARENAELIEKEPEEFFPGSDAYASLSLYADALDDVSPDTCIAFLKQAEEKAKAYDARVVHTDNAFLQWMSMEKVLFNNKGLDVSEKNNFLLVVLSVLAKEKEETKSGMTFRVVKDFSELDADAMAEETVEKALRALGGRTYPNKDYPTVLHHEAASALLTTFASSFSAEAVQKEQSRLKDKLDERIASEIVTIQDDPFRPRGTKSTAFDAEGVPTQTWTVVDRGRLKTYFHNQSTAKKDGLASSTGHASRGSYKSSLGVSPSNFFIAPGKHAYGELYGDMDEGIIITDIAGMHSGANPISGDFSVAADGFYVKDGKIVSPTNQMTIAGNFFEVLQDVTAVADDLEFSSNSIGSPSLRIKQLSVAVD